MIIPVLFPLTDIPDPALTILAQAGQTSALEALNQQASEFAVYEASALAQANDLLNDGYTLLFRERVETAQGTSLCLFFHKPPTPIESVEQTAIKEAIYLYNHPPQPQTDGAGEHPDTHRLRAVMDVLLKVGIFPDDPPVSDDTEVDARLLRLEEVGW